MNRKKVLYVLILIVSVMLAVLSFTLLGKTKIVAPIIVVISLYLFIGAIIKLCGENEKLKNTIICLIDVLFWLP